jgi:hypothetical protein
MEKPIRVIILSDGIVVKKWVADIVQFVIDSPKFELVGTIINESNNKSDSSFLYRSLRYVDRKLFSTSNNPFQNIQLNFDSKLIYRTKPIQKQYSDWLNEDCMNHIKFLEPDLILRFGFRILRGSFLNIPRFGVWSLHHGDNKVNRGGPPAFWEVVLKEPISGVTLQKINEDLDGGVVIGKAFTKTDFLSFYRNQVHVYEIGVQLFKDKLAQLNYDNLNIEKPVFNFYDYPLYRNPSNSDSFKIFINYFLRILNKKYSDTIYEQQWIIKHSKKNNNETSIYRYTDLIPPKGFNWADPFPIYDQNTLYLFAEQIGKDRKGKIVCFEYDTTANSFSDPKLILEEKHHLSYPFVFKYNEKWLMIPESGDSEQLTIYKSIEFPYRWEIEKNIFNDKKLFDVTPFQYNSKWYSFASERILNYISPNDYLTLYELPEGPLGEWRLHNSSPIKIDVRGGRCAGKVLERDGKYYRVAQLGAPKYGFAIQYYEILNLDSTSYDEKLVETIYPNWDTTSLAIHTFNTVNGWHFVDCQRQIKKKFI